MYEDNLPRVAGVEVEKRKAKRYEDDVGSGVKVEIRKSRKK